MWCLKAVKDQVSLSICPCTEEKEHLLEEMILEEEILPMAAQVIQGMEESETPHQRRQGSTRRIIQDSLEVAHTELATMLAVHWAGPITKVGATPTIASVESQC